MTKAVGLIGMALVVGCAAGVVGKELIVPTAGAQALGKRFEHRCANLKWGELDDGAELRPDFGAEGWELVTFSSAMQGGTTRIFACFKRELP